MIPITNRLLFAVFLVLCPFYSYAQVGVDRVSLDRWLAEVPDLKEDTVAVKILFYISKAYTAVNPDEGLKWADRDMDLARKLDWKWGQGVAYNAKGSNYLAKDMYSNALDEFLRAQKIFDELVDSIKIAEAFNNIGLIYWRLGKPYYQKSIANYTTALKMSEQQNDLHNQRVINGNLGLIYADIGLYNTAIPLQLKSLQLARTLQDRYGIITQTGNVGSSLAKCRQYALGLQYLFNALRLSEQIDDKDGIAINSGSIGCTYVDIFKDTNKVAADSLIPRGKKEQQELAIKYLRQGVDKSVANNILGPVTGYLEGLIDMLETKKDYHGALDAYKSYALYKDSLNNRINVKNVANLEHRRQIELRDKDIQLAELTVIKKRNERGYFSVGLGLLSVLLFVLYINFANQKKAKKISDSLLLNILPSEVADELKTQGKTTARQFDEVSVLFTDFVNFTATSQQYSPQYIVQELNECFTQFDKIAEKHGLQRIKTIGDAYMAVCGLPVNDVAHAHKVTRAAVEIRDFIADRRKQGRIFDIRIGINSGDKVVAGVVGVSKFAYDIWGETVNTAARMEQSSQPGCINISHSTYELIKGDFDITPRGGITAKGIGLVEMYFVG